jgi:hypothetical protein
MAGPDFGLTGGGLSHGGLNGTAKIVTEGSPRTSPPSFETMPDFPGPLAGFLFWRQQPQLQPAGGESGWLPVTVCAGPAPLSRLDCVLSGGV